MNITFVTTSVGCIALTYYVYDKINPKPIVNKNHAFSHTYLTEMNFPSGPHYVTVADRWVTTIVIPSTATSISPYALGDCANLNSVVIPSSVTIIGDQAFKRCCSLQQITIPSNITFIGKNAFSGCYSLRVVEMSDNTRVKLGLTFGRNQDFYGTISDIIEKND